MTGYREIAQTLKREWRAQAKLPPHAELQARFGCSQVTIQRATRLLRDQGFVQTTPKVGTFYVARPPHRHRIGIVFPGRPGAIVRNWRWSRLFAALESSICCLERESEYRVVPYFDVNPETPGGKVEDELAGELNEQLLAGLILPFTPFMMGESEWLREARVPVVTAGAVDFMQSSIVRLDHGDFIRRALNWLIRQERRRIAVIMPTQRLPEYFEPFAAEFGVPAKPHWFQGVDPFQPEWLRHNLEIMLEGPLHERPDALLITDDHLVGAAMKALGELGLRVPDELLVVGHWNFPLPYGGELPVELVGFDAREWLRCALRQIEEHHRGADPCAATMIPARFVAELSDPMFPADVNAGLEETQTGHIVTDFVPEI